MNLASKKEKYYTCSSMKEKALEMCFVPHLGGPNVISSDRSSILTA